MRGNAAADPDDLDVRDRPKLLEEVLQSPIAQHHRIATAHDDVADFGVLAEILDRRIVLIKRDLLRIADLATPSAESAIVSAYLTDEKQCAVRIPVRDVRHR